MNDNIRARLVDREVHYCISSLIHHLASNPDSLKGSDYSYEDVLDLCVQDDYESAVREHPGFWHVDSDGLIEVTEDAQAINPASWRTTYENWQDAADHLGIDPYEREAFEHWIISQFLADKLREKGEMVGELFGLTIWGRCTTGMAIYMDGVIGRIAEEMEILEGQKYSWAPTNEVLAT